MATVTAIVNSKGGVGKTTLAVHLALWQRRAGRRVLFVDADPQASAAAWLAEAAPDVAVRRASGGRAIVEAVAAAPPGVDQIVCDGPAKLDVETAALVGQADRALIPIGTSLVDLRAAADAVRLVREVQLRRGGRPAAAIVLNRVQNGTRLALQAPDAARRLGLPVCRRTVGQRTAYADAAGQGAGVWDLGPRAQAAADELDAVFREALRIAR